MSYTRESIREAIERAGDEHWQTLIAHHTDAYPASRPTPGDICRMEADRLNGLGLGDAPEFELMETRVERADQEVIVTHVLRYRTLGIRLCLEPYRGYA